MTKLSREDIAKVAHLAKLAIPETEIEFHVKNLANILDLVEQMNEVNTDGIPPMAHPLEIAQPLREDKITEPNQRELLQSITPLMEDGHPAVKHGFYLVPKVIE